VKFEAVSFSHRNGVIALRDVNVSIKNGELVAILGTNGAGKSTFVRHINGLLKPTRGFVTVFGADTRSTSAAKLSRRVGIVFQNPNNQLFAQTVNSEIEFALRNFGYDEILVQNRLNWALNSFGLTEYKTRSPMELSGGEKKRLCIALVLAWDPEILILDEPTVGQDSDQKEKLAQEIRLLLTQNKTVILVTHDVEFVWPLQPRIILMSQGEVIADGPAQKIMQDFDALKNANVLPPQLIDFSKLMNWSIPLPKDEYEARSRLRPKEL
jgi:energy-coupling factor transport system ATP-binding protein